ncbi:MAG: gfo/Idh/MocA family oxidoreductase [Chloroflexi bacterium]|nr:MAG: gfo/Idh/MocA family oxidoreductase [Chloroflexota bacterium]
MSKPLELIVIGAGHRGADAYASYAFTHPGEVRFVGVAEPDPIRRRRFADDHDLDESQCFTSWEALLDKGQLGDAAIVTTQDQMHVEPAVAAMQAGYHVLLEKPMAHTLEGCIQLVQTAERTGRVLQICHVLRYSPFWRALHEVLAAGRLGDIITVEHRENVAYWHMAHSFVRGNWRNQALSSPMILAKCCHDLDILVWNLASPVRRLSSVGSLLHYRADQAGPEIPARCTDGCPIERECPFSAIGIYLDLRPFDYLAAEAAARGIDPEAPKVWPFTVLSHDVSRAGRLAALQTGPYGRCVYRCDNDVVDHQVVTMELESGPSVILVMHGHSNEEHRSMRYDGTRATLRARFGRASEITVHDHATGAVEQVPIPQPQGGHGGGDHGLMSDFLRVLRGEAEPLTSARASLESHLLAFAAEEARLAGTVVDMAAFRARAEALTRQFAG